MRRAGLLPNKRLKLAAVIALGEAECCALTGTEGCPPSLRCRARRPQLKRDPLDGARRPQLKRGPVGATRRSHLVLTLLERIAFVLALATLVFAGTNRASTGRKVDSILLAGGILLGSLHSVLTMTATARLALSVAALILALALLARLVLAN